MHSFNKKYPYYNAPKYYPNVLIQSTTPCPPSWYNETEATTNNNSQQPFEYDNNLMDYGPEPYVVNIEEATTQNNAYRTALWTGDYLQVTLMSITEDIGLEIHPDLDQFIRIEEGQGLVMMGDREDRLDFQEYVYDDFAFIIPAGKWHNLINMGDSPLKLYSIYAPPQHPYGTVHETKEDAMAAEEE